MFLKKKPNSEKQGDDNGDDYDSDEKETNRRMNAFFSDDANYHKTKRMGVGASKLSNEQVKKQTGKDAAVDASNPETKELKYKILERHSVKKRQRKGRGPTVSYGESSEEEEENNGDAKQRQQQEQLVILAKEEQIKSKSSTFNGSKTGKNTQRKSTFDQVRESLTANAEEEPVAEPANKKQKIWKKPW